VDKNGRAVLLRTLDQIRDKLFSRRDLNKKGVEYRIRELLSAGRKVGKIHSRAILGRRPQRLTGNLGRRLRHQSRFTVSWSEGGSYALSENVSEKEATGRLADIYGELMKSPLAGGRVFNIMKCIGLRPEALNAVWRLNMSITFGASTLGRRREEIIATAVSALNHCHY
jgi:hypothetical protein